MKFEWDELKNEANKRNHGISFETAAFVLVMRIVQKYMMRFTVKLMTTDILQQEK